MEPTTDQPVVAEKLLESVKRQRESTERFAEPPATPAVETCAVCGHAGMLTSVWVCTYHDLSAAQPLPTTEARERAGVTRDFTEVDRFTENYIASLPWSDTAENEKKTLVAGNLRRFAEIYRNHLLRGASDKTRERASRLVCDWRDEWRIPTPEGEQLECQDDLISRIAAALSPTPEPNDAGKLGHAIVMAAFARGIISADAVGRPFTGPELLTLCVDLSQPTPSTEVKQRARAAAVQIARALADSQEAEEELIELTIGAILKHFTTDVEQGE